ncbi:MAG TPA: RHS repeat-associated core domain-containing protein [Thermoanaerobaculia bacterium]|nr:RHS repeat-associated core domain-containing protein [Thermoanaerobaculia bacterium]
MTLLLLAAGAAGAGTPSAPKVAPTDGPVTSIYGPIVYDQSGNIVAIGHGDEVESAYKYDARERLMSATVNRKGFEHAQTYTYDAYGNRTSVTTASTTTTYSVDPLTNRLTPQTFGADYDTAGNLKEWLPPGQSSTRYYAYDALNMQTREAVSASDGIHTRHYLYAADDERYEIFETVPAPGGTKNTANYTLRDLSGNVLRDYREEPCLPSCGTTFTIAHDYIYRDGALLTDVTPAATYHHSLDQVGTPRLITNASAERITEHTYYPFGVEITDDDPTDGQLRFTGHERDPDILGATSGVLDYMHARYYSSNAGRFLSVDPGNDWDLRQPQSWNLYSYARNSPIRFTDPSGREHVAEPGFTKSLNDADWSEAPPVVRIAFVIEGTLLLRATGSMIRTAVTTVGTVTRYMSDGEADAARRTGNIPDTDAQGNPRPTHITTDRPVNSSETAQARYELPVRPTQSATVPATRVPGGLQPAPDGRATTSGGGSQSATNQPIPVNPSEIKPLDQSWWQRLKGIFK